MKSLDYSDRSRASAPLPRRPLVIISCAALLVLALGVAFGGSILTGRFEQAEAAAAAEKSLQVYRAFDADFRQLAVSNSDYAHWDDAAEYVHSHNPRFISSSFVPNSLAGMRVDVVLIVDRDGHELYSGAKPRSGSQLISPLAQSHAQLTQLATNARHFMRLPTAERIAVTPQGLAAVSAIEITRSDGSAPTGATMLFARYIEEADIARVRETSHLNVQFLRLGTAATYPQPLHAWLGSAASAAPTFVLADSSRQISGYALVKGVDGAPVGLLVTHSGRGLFALAQRTIWTLLAGLVGLFVAFAAAVVWLDLRLRRSLHARQVIEARYRKIAAQLPDAIVLIDANSHAIVEANESVLRMLGCSQAGLQSHKLQEIFPDISAAVLAEAAQADAGRTMHESRACGANGTWVENEVAITPMDFQRRRLLTLVGHDVSHRKEAEERERSNRRRLLQLAQHDSLTGLPNRLYLHTKLPQVLTRVQGNGTLVAVVYVDVDNFKNINDSLGHGCGDQLLQIIAKRLRASVSAQDLVARMGGDEFVICAPLMPDVAAIEALALRLQTAVSAPVMLEEEPVTVTASIGIAVCPRDGADAKTLLKHADIALYQAKEVGRNCHRFFAAEMDRRLSQHVAHEQALRLAVGTEQIFMEYQPVIDLRTGRLSSLEALMRWRRPKTGLVPPVQFIPVAEKSGLIIELGQQALKIVLAQIRAWLDANVLIVPIAVNVSPLQLDRYDFAALVAQLAAEAQVDPSWLRFELTESAVMKDPDKLIGTLASLRALGSQVLIDDFGTGYSSLSYLNRLPIDTLKIDYAFVRDLGKNTERTPIIHAVIDIAKKLNLSTVAEGVETSEQATLLLETGCDYAQGYYYSRPVAARHCRSLLDELGREKALTQTMLVRAMAS